MARKKFSRDKILDLVKTGLPVSAVAEELGLCKKTVFNAIREARILAAAAARPAPSAGEPRTITAEIDDGTSAPERLLAEFSGLALQALARLSHELESGRPGNAYAYTAGVLSQRAIECQKYVDLRSGVPSSLPSNAKKRAEALQAIAYKRAVSGSATGLREAIAAASQDSRIEITWSDDAADPAEAAASAAAAPPEP